MTPYIIIGIKALNNNITEYEHLTFYQIFSPKIIES